MNLFRQETCLYDSENPDNRIQVYDRGDVRELRFGNHIVQSAQSQSDPDRLVLDYTRAMVSGLMFRPEPETILHVGLGAGSIPSFIHRHFPEVQQRVVELSPEVVQVAYRFFDLPRSDRLRVTINDGAEFLLATPDRYDLIFLDAFHADGASPHIYTTTAVGLARERLRPGGWLLVNAWGSDRVELRRTFQIVAAQFSEVWSLSVRVDSNVIMFAGNPSRSLGRTVLREQTIKLKKAVPTDFVHWAERLREGVTPIG